MDPSTATALVAPPTTTTTVTNPEPGHYAIAEEYVTHTRTLVYGADNVTVSGYTESQTDSTRLLHVYTPAYFTAHFASPTSVALSFTTPPSSLAATSGLLAGSAAGAACAVSASQSDTFTNFTLPGQDPGSGDAAAAVPAPSAAMSARRALVSARPAAQAGIGARAMDAGTGLWSRTSITSIGQMVYNNDYADAIVWNWTPTGRNVDDMVSSGPLDWSSGNGSISLSMTETDTLKWLSSDSAPVTTVFAVSPYVSWTSWTGGSSIAGASFTSSCSDGFGDPEIKSFDMQDAYGTSSATHLVTKNTSSGSATFGPIAINCAASATSAPSIDLGAILYAGVNVQDVTPHVAITAPGHTVDCAPTITVAATADASIAGLATIQKIEVVADQGTIFIDLPGIPCVDDPSVTGQWQNVKPGRHILRAIATYTDGTTVVSPDYLVTVVENAQMEVELVHGFIQFNHDRNDSWGFWPKTRLLAFLPGGVQGFVYPGDDPGAYASTATTVMWSTDPVFVRGLRCDILASAANPPVYCLLPTPWHPYRYVCFTWEMQMWVEAALDEWGP